MCDSEIALRYKGTVRSIEGLRKRFVEEGFHQVVYGKKRTVFKEKTSRGRAGGSPLGGAAVQRCAEGHSAWTLQLLADPMVRLRRVESISYEPVRQLLKIKMN